MVSIRQPRAWQARVRARTSAAVLRGLLCRGSTRRCFELRLLDLHVAIGRTLTAQWYRRSASSSQFVRLPDYLTAGWRCDRCKEWFYNHPVARLRQSRCKA